MGNQNTEMSVLPEIEDTQNMEIAESNTVQTVYAINKRNYNAVVYGLIINDKKQTNFR